MHTPTETAANHAPGNQPAAGDAATTSSDASGTHGGALTHSPAQAQPRPRGIERHTGRPIAAYPRQPTFAARYVEQFSRALGLRPADTQLDGKVTKL